MNQDDLDELARAWHTAFHRAWTNAAMGRYDKADWRELDRVVSALIRAAGVAPPHGLPMAGDRVS